MKYRVSVGITTNMGITATNWIANTVQSLGADGIWIGEDIGLGQDVFVLTAAVIAQSAKIRVGTGIIPATVHDVLALARAALSLQKLGGGRFIFGTGIGGIQDLQTRGITIKKPVTELRKIVEIFRKLWDGQEVTIGSELMQLHNQSLNMKSSETIPVFLGVRGPQMLELAGKIAEGVILSGPFEYLKYAIETVDKAAINSGQKKDSVEKVIWLPTIPTFKGMNEKLAKKVVAIVVADTPSKVLDMLNLERKKLDTIRTTVAGKGPSAAAPYIDQEVMDMFSISGTRSHMVDRFEVLIDMGATEVVIGPPFSGDWRGAMTQIFEEIKSRND